MDKEIFLRLQYLRMINSDDFVVEQWRSSIDRFIADMWERTPPQHGRRFLAPVDPTLGFSPDNVEWQFPKIKAKPAKKAKTLADTLVISRVLKRPTKAERKAMKQAEAAAAREAKRQAIAAELAAWNDGQLIRRG
jgi:hypothetical protein